MTKRVFGAILTFVGVVTGTFRSSSSSRMTSSTGSGGSSRESASATTPEDGRFIAEMTLFTNRSSRVASASIFRSSALCPFTHRTHALRSFTKSRGLAFFFSPPLRRALAKASSATWTCRYWPSMVASDTESR